MSQPVRRNVKLSSGSMLPTIGLGVYLVPLRQTTEVVETALEIGYRHVDTARIYGNEQQTAEGICNFLQKNPDVKRSEIFYTTKIWNSDYGYDNAKLAVEESLEDAQSIEYIDLVLLHTPESTKDERLSAYKALQEFVDSGKVKNIGVSNYGVRHLQELLSWPGLKHKPVVNQIEINPWLQHTDITDFCKSHDIVIQAYSPLMFGSSRLKTDPELRILSAKYRRTPAQIVLRWNLQKGFVPLPKSVNPNRLRENFEVYDFELSDEDIANLGSPKEKFLCCTGHDPTLHS